MSKHRYTRAQKVVLFVMEHIHDLKDRGIIKGGYELTAEGRKDAKALIKSGFEPTDKEFEYCMEEIMR